MKKQIERDTHSSRGKVTLMLLTLIVLLGLPQKSAAQQTLGFNDVISLLDTAGASIADCGAIPQEWNESYGRHILIQTWKRLVNEGLAEATDAPDRFVFSGQTLPPACEKSILQFMGSQFDQDSVSFPGISPATVYSYSYRDGDRTNMHLEVLKTIGDTFQIIPDTQNHTVPRQSGSLARCRQDTTNNALGLNFWICDCGSYGTSQCRQIMQRNGCDFDASGMFGLCPERIRR